MGKKIGVITYHNAINYGAVLQAYALNRYLNKYVERADVINYSSPAIDLQYRYKKPSESFSIKNFFAHNLICFLHRKKKKKFIEFLKCISLSEKYTRDELAKADYDIYITGSDQVFNPVCNKSDATFFLDFTNKPKYSYAASMGSIEQFKTSRLDTKKLLMEFDEISMRENDAAEYLSKELGRECYSVMDPVWLLNKEEWEDIVDAGPKEDYILVYNLMDYRYMRDYVVKLSKGTGLPVYVVNRTIIGEYLYFGRSRSLSNASPQEFLGLIKNSKYFVTDSFHGTSFAIIFEKNFAVALNPNKDSTNSRLQCILNNLGIDNRIISENCNPFNFTIDYEKVSQKVSPLIIKSKQFLGRICDE